MGRRPRRVDPSQLTMDAEFRRWLSGGVGSRESSPEEPKVISELSAHRVRSLVARWKRSWLVWEAKASAEQERSRLLALLDRLSNCRSVEELCRRYTEEGNHTELVDVGYFMAGREIGRRQLKQE